MCPKRSVAPRDLLPQSAWTDPAAAHIIPPIYNSKKQPPLKILSHMSDVDILCSSSGMIQTPLPLLMMIDALTLFSSPATAASTRSTTDENGQIFRRTAFLQIYCEIAGKIACNPLFPFEISLTCSIFKRQRIVLESERNEQM